MPNKKVIFGVLGGLLLLFMLFGAGKLWEDVDAGEIVVIQDPVDGELHVYKSSGLRWQGWGKATHYKKSNQFWFSIQTDKDGDTVGNKSIPVKWNDGGHAAISGSVRYDLPIDDNQIIKLHSTFGSQLAIEEQLIKTNIEKAIYLTGPLMSSKESYAERRNDLIFYIEDQASKGVYRTRQRDMKEIDPITNTEKTITKVEIQIDTSGNPYRQEKSPIALSGINLYNVAINGIVYDKSVEEQIAAQQKAIMQVQTAMAKSREAEQRALTVEKEGEANAAQAKWEQEVEKAKRVTAAEAEKAEAELKVQTAALYKQEQTLIGEGDASRKKAAMIANGALEQKLDAWLKAQQYWAEAFSKFQGNIVPSTMFGGNGTSGGGNGLNYFMDLMSAKAAKDLNLDLSNK